MFIEFKGGQQKMKMFKSGEFVKMENPTPGSTYKQDLLKKLNAQSLSGVFGLAFPAKGGIPSSEGQHIIFIISGEGGAVEEIPTRPAISFTSRRRKTCDHIIQGSYATGSYCTPGKADEVG
jgi:hypothetical protein